MKSIDFLISSLSKINLFIFRLKRKNYLSLNQLDKKLETLLPHTNGFYVELGANDGLNQSNSYYFEKVKKWRGVLVEPSPNKFFECKKNRSSRNFFFCNACVGFDYKSNYVNMIYSNLMTISDSLNLNLEEKQTHLSKSKVHLKDYEDIIEFGSKAKTLTEILDLCGAPQIIDFLSLDVEGAELEVLKGINFDHYKFKYLLIEIWDLDTVNKFLVNAGYTLIDSLSHHDFLFKNNNL